MLGILPADGEEAAINAALDVLSVKAYVAHEKYAAVTAAMNWGGAAIGRAR